MILAPDINIQTYLRTYPCCCSCCYRILVTFPELPQGGTKETLGYTGPLLLAVFAIADIYIFI